MIRVKTRLASCYCQFKHGAFFILSPINLTRMSALPNDQINEILPMLDSIKKETRPIEGHSDANSLNDCWRWLRDDIESLIEEVKSSRRNKAYMSEVMNSGDGTYQP